MARLIDADKLLKSIEDNSYPVSQKHNSVEKGMTIAGIKQCIEEQPTVDAEPVRRGKWIEKPYLIGISNFCSVCSENFGSKYKRCPNCGAKMEDQ